MSRLTPMYPPRTLFDFDISSRSTKKRREGHHDPRRDDLDDPDHDRDDDHNHDGHHKGGGRRIALIENAFKRRVDELKNLQQAFTEALDGKRPLDPPIQFGTAVQRAWLHSVDPHDYRDQLEKQIDQAERSLAKLEETL
ncbi:hypothetical protein BGZ70_009086 [Mortierella alpina]|uniref:Uncharacterized protein n=1 Tax=Mortierella alpina TaxID=64518 RepID=A0A9P6J228_MORAP|nr:hypothetical protein BGZ70_009086 [Mortierella alpina]